MIGFYERESKTLTRKLQELLRFADHFQALFILLTPENLKVCNYVIVLGLVVVPEFS